MKILLKSVAKVSWTGLGIVIRFDLDHRTFLDVTWNSSSQNEFFYEAVQDKVNLELHSIFQSIPEKLKICCKRVMWPVHQVLSAPMVKSKNKKQNPFICCLRFVLDRRDINLDFDVLFSSIR